MTSLLAELPSDLVDAIGAEKLQLLALEALLVKLYDLGEVSSGRAAATLGMTRRDFLDLLGQYHVSIFDDTMDVSAEARRG